MTSVRFANAVLDNIGASVSFGEHENPGHPESSARGEVNATWDEIASNPLAIGLEEDIRRVRHDASNNETIEEISSETS